MVLGDKPSDWFFSDELRRVTTSLGESCSILTPQCGMLGNSWCLISSQCQYVLSFYTWVLTARALWDIVLILLTSKRNSRKKPSRFSQPIIGSGRVPSADLLLRQLGALSPEEDTAQNSPSGTLLDFPNPFQGQDQSWQLQFPSSSLLMARKGSWPGPKSLSSCSHMGKILDSQLWLLWPFEGEPMAEGFACLSHLLSVWLCLSNKKNKWILQNFFKT